MTFERRPDREILTLVLAGILFATLLPRSLAAQGAPAESRDRNEVATTDEEEATDMDDDRIVIELSVEGASIADELRDSSAAVTVVETEQAQTETADLGEVLARSEGVGVRRAGGLGSDERVSLAGLTDDQIRLFLDGIPLQLMGYPLGVANVPVNFVERVDVYRGVVPIRFGADALGGAINLVGPEELHGTHGGASWQAGSFGTQRLTANVRHMFDPSGVYFRASGFFDRADNDYLVDVEVADAQGRLSDARVRRYHDAYSAGGGTFELGVVGRPLADRLWVRLLANDYRKELQHNAVMTVPFGEPVYGEFTSGALVGYEHAPRFDLSIEALGGYTYNAAEFIDVGDCVYNWFGQCVAERRLNGELTRDGRDQILRTQSAYGRLNLEYAPHYAHTIRFSTAPTYTRQTGNSRHLDPEALDALEADRDITTIVSGVEYELDAVGDRLENVLFAKSYIQLARSEELLPGPVRRREDRDTIRYGVGNALRFRVVESLILKASWEYATRLPRPSEIFGNGVLVGANLGLQPEVSQNVNLGAAVNSGAQRTGEWRAEVTGFIRSAERLIVLIGTSDTLVYRNVFGARSAGAEVSGSWVSPGEWVELGGNVTYFELRNTSSRGTFGAFDGDRIPNRPYLFGNVSATVRARDVADGGDELRLAWHTRYVHEFFRTWESLGRAEFKQTIPSQALHSLALTYETGGDATEFSFTGEVQNLTDARSLDSFGAQRPGRAVYFKATATF